MRILAIETSCDDTCVAILEAGGNKNPRFKILSNIISSQVKLHAKYGGVYPFLAKREHQRNLPIVLKKALKETKDTKATKIDLIAVTNGPGLEPCLWVGVNFGKELAKKLNLSLISVNHIEAHIFANWLSPFVGVRNSECINRNLFPAVCLVVSGGHTQLILMKDISEYKILGETRDDAAGECFDKVARILGLGYPGGTAIATEATKYKIPRSTPHQILVGGLRGRQDTRYEIQLPRPMIYQKNYDFSFSGLKTAVLYLVKNLTLGNNKILTIDQKREICIKVQQSIIDVLIHKTIRAAKEYNVKTIILGGGVVANEELRKQFKEKIKEKLPNIQYLIPNIQFCTDNAVMVAVAGYFHRQEKRKPEDIEAEANQRL